jgi:hypothetical protein
MLRAALEGLRARRRHRRRAAEDFSVLQRTLRRRERLPERSKSIRARWNDFDRARMAASAVQWNSSPVKTNPSALGDILARSK